MNLQIILVLLTIIAIALLNYKKIQLFIDYIKEQIAIDFKKRTNLDWYTLNRLSAPKSFIWGFLFKSPVLYFDDNYLYITKSSNPVIKYPISANVELRKTNVMINDRKVWKIIIDDSGKQINYKFRIYRNFNLFLEKVSGNPKAIVEERYIWKFLNNLLSLSAIFLESNRIKYIENICKLENLTKIETYGNLIEKYSQILNENEIGKQVIHKNIYYHSGESYEVEENNLGLIVGRFETIEEALIGKQQADIKTIQNLAEVNILDFIYLIKIIMTKNSRNQKIIINLSLI